MSESEIPFVVTVGQATLDKRFGPGAADPIRYGESTFFTFRISYPGRQNDADLATVREHPLRFTVSADNAEIGQNEFAFKGGSDRTFDFNLVAKETTAGIPPPQVTLNVRSTSDPTIVPWSQIYQVEVPENTSTWDHPINRPPSRRRYLKLRFDAATPASATPGPASRRGWPLMTLAGVAATNSPSKEARIAHSISIS